MLQRLKNCFFKIAETALYKLPDEKPESDKENENSREEQEDKKLGIDNVCGLLELKGFVLKLRGSITFPNPSERERGRKL